MLEYLKKKFLHRIAMLPRFSFYSQNKHEQWVFFLGIFEGVFLSEMVHLPDDEKEELFFWLVVLYGLEDEYTRETGERIPLQRRQRILEELEQREQVSA